MTFFVIMVLEYDSTSTDNITKVLDIESDGPVNEISNAMRVQLGLLGVLARASSTAQLVRAITLQM